jgi:hypothetical protein
MTGVSAQTDTLAELWKWMATTQVRGDSPIYERISMAVAADGEILEMILTAPPAAHMPLTLLGAVHYLLLDGLDHPLAGVYAGHSDADPGPLFLDVCRSHRPEVLALLSTRHVQTNDCGRSAMIGPGLTWLASRLDGPFALVDVGASAGINLLCDRYRIDYGTHGVTGPADSPVQITCRVVAGHPPIAELLPPLVTRLGIDRSPIDLSDPDDARWLLACVWPDSGRLDRTAASIRLAQNEKPPLRAGDAIDTLPVVLAALPPDTTALVVTTSAFAYLTMEDRPRFVELMQDASRTRAVAWLSSEEPGVVEAFAGEVSPDDDHAHFDLVGAMTFDGGETEAHMLGYAHKHGLWLDWRST